MRHVTLTTFAVATALVAIVACEQQAPDRSPTAPDGGASFARAPGGTCDATRAKLIGTQQSDLYPKLYADSAKSLFAPVVDNCLTNLDVAKSYMMTYIQWTIGHTAQQLPPATGTRYGALINHWNTVFPYVGYIGNDQPNGVPESILDGSGGVAGVITQATTNRELRTPIAALTLPIQNTTGDQRPHLFVIYPLGNNCLGDTNLRRIGPCYEFASYPHVSPAFDPMIKVGVCQPNGPDHQLQFSALGHNVGSFVEIPNQETYPTCLTAYAADEGSWNGGVSGILKRLASITQKTFGVQTAYAVHGGLGGLGGGISPFGGVDLTVFRDFLHSETLGTPPTTPEVGTWTDTAKAPGTVLVQSSLGNYRDTVIVLSQAGGNCDACKGLLLQANLADSTPTHSGATNGLYEVSWVSLQDGPTVKSAPFILRDTAGATGHIIAKVTYVTKSNQNKIYFNNDEVGCWVQHEPQRFTIRVDLDNDRADLSFAPLNPLQPSCATGSHAYQGFAAGTAFKQLAADFSGIDSGIMGWAEILVRRLPGQ